MTERLYSRTRAKKQERFYLERIESFGIHSPGAVGWTEYLQQLLFDHISGIFTEAPEGEVYSLLDVGCGLGDFVDYLRVTGFDKRIDYTGIDILPEMIAGARVKHPSSRFIVGDFASRAFARGFDYVICSGALNIITEKDHSAHLKFVMRFIEKMYSLSNRACAINLLAEPAREYFPGSDDFFYTDHDQMRRFCAELAFRCDLKMKPHDIAFTVCLWK